MLTPVPFANVAIDDVFWAPRMKTNHEVTIPHEYEQCKQTGRIDAFRLQWKPGMKPVPHIFWDSDVAKWVEAASYCLATRPDPKLDALVDEVVALIAGAQQKDGYLNSHFIQVEPQNRFKNLAHWHELYCAGHLIEAGVAHFQATGKRALLDTVRRYADYIDSYFGPGKHDGCCGHEEIELALVKLYRVTGEKRYLDLA
ncbi:glycoside hydrolase family 127 protein, partial [Candidatus Sumerlaeota bacterium]|nr:glycoside hydrolase family 127 protein [Candidatus Sumerlaeota bacterium]